MRKFRIDSPQTWQEVKERAMEPKNFGGLILYFFIWAMLGFHPWIGFGLAFPVLGILGLRSGKKIRVDDIYLEEIEDRTTAAIKPQTEPAVNDTGAIVQKIHLQIIEEAKDDFTQIEAAANVADGQLGADLRDMVTNAQIVERGLIEDPTKLSQVQRLFTYYIPATADLLKARGKAAALGDANRTTEVDVMISRLRAAYEDFGARLHGEDARSVEIDIKMLDQSLAQEFDHLRR